MSVWFLSLIALFYITDIYNGDEGGPASSYPPGRECMICFNLK